MLMALQVTDPEYAEFFKQTFQEFMDPAAKVHFSAEGTIEFTALLFIPGMAPFQPEVCCLAHVLTSEP